MSQAPKLKDLHRDAIELTAALDVIPPACDCGDASSHLDGRCCCRAPKPQLVADR